MPLVHSSAVSAQGLELVRDPEGSGSPAVQPGRATLRDALAADARILIGALIDPVEWDDGRLRASRNRARLARSNAEASIERMLGEPEINRRIEPQLALGILAATRRYALGALALHAQLTERPIRPRPSLAALRQQNSKIRSPPTG